MTPFVAPAVLPPLRLRRLLLWRLGAAFVVVIALLAWRDWRDWREQTRAALPATAALVTQLLNDDLARETDGFARARVAPRLEVLGLLATRVPFCAALHDVGGRLRHQACMPALEGAGWRADRAASWLGGAEDDGLVRSLTVPPGILVGSVSVRPHWAYEARRLWPRWEVLGAAALAWLVALVAASGLVRRALAPANQVLGVLARQIDGDLGVRVPAIALPELHRIGQGINRMADHWASVRRQQSELARHLLEARESERRRLARELHDEMGQGLAALQAEAASVQWMAGSALPQAGQAAQAMVRTIGVLLEGLQRVLADLRPAALDRFGLAVALSALVAQPRRRADGSDLAATLAVEGVLPVLPADHDVHVYRIVQEALTNALRHGGARRAEVRLRSGDQALHLCVVDDGAGVHAATGGGHGLLGMRERVQALGGEIHHGPGAAGWQLDVWLPLAPTPPLPSETLR